MQSFGYDIYCVTRGTPGPDHEHYSVIGVVQPNGERTPIAADHARHLTSDGSSLYASGSRVTLSECACGDRSITADTDLSSLAAC
jgi:hypothetical protein